MKADDDIRNLRVGISTDSDLFLRGAKGEVEYRFEEPALKSIDAAGIGAPQESVAIDRFVKNIGQGRITKTASNLAPLESYKVEGSYAKSKLALYGKELLIFVAVVLAIFAGLVLLVKFVTF